MEKYIYEPLNLDRPAIRLLHLHQGGDNSEISCSLSLVELNQRDDTVSYEALSYTWGSPALTGRIIVDGCYLNVTYNLHSALQQIRYSDVDRILWIDAICIDQENKKERGHQVEQMSKIYSEAERVIFWLGPGTVETDMLMESLQLLQHESIYHRFRDWSLQDDRWKNLWTSMEITFERSHKQFRTLQREGLRQLLARPWFRRVWILQEVALAKAGIIICGRKGVSARLFGVIPLVLEIKPDPHCQSVLDIMPSLWRKTSWWSKSPNLRTLLLSFGDSEATEPRDLVYALRGLSSDAAEKNGIVPDYDKSEEHLVREVVQFVEHCELEELALKTPPRSVRDLIECLRDLDLGRCMVLAQKSLPRDMAMHLEKSKARVNQEIFMTAVACDKTGELVELLLRYRQQEFILDDTIFLSAAKNEIGAKGVFEGLFRYAGGQVTISDKALTAVAENEQYGDEIFKALFHFQGKKIAISEGVLTAAAGNKQCGNEIFEALFCYARGQITISDKALTAVAENEQYGDKIFKALFGYQGDQIAISEGILTAAAGNKQCGNGIFEALFYYARGQITISDKALIAVAENEQYGDKIFKALFHFQGDQIAISEGILTAAAGNKQCGNGIFEALFYYREDKMNVLANVSANVLITAMEGKQCVNIIFEALLQYQEDQIKISDKVLIKTAENKRYGDIIPEALSRYQGDPIMFSDQVLIAAANNRQYGDVIFEAFFHYHGNQIKTADEMLGTAERDMQRDNVISAYLLSSNRSMRFGWYQLEDESIRLLQVAAANGRCGDKIINILLSHRPDLVNFTQEIATTAAKNEECGDRIMDTLLSHRPHLGIFFKEIAITAAKNKGCGDRIITTLLSYRPYLGIFSKKVAITAAKNEGCGDRIMDTLLSHCPHLEIFFKEIAITAAKNKKCGDKIMTTLASHCPDLAYVFSEEIAITAAKNKGCGDRIMTTLVSYCPNLPISSLQRLL